MKKKIFAIMIVVVMVFAMSACGGSSSEDTDTALADLQKNGVIRVGMCPEYPPFESINTSGDIEGFDVDLANAIAKEMGVEKVEFVNTPYEGLIAGLQAGDFDVIMSGMSPEEPAQADDSLNVSDSYFTIAEVILTKDSNIKSKKDLEGKTVGSHAGSTSEYAVDGLAEEGIKVKSAPYNRHSEAFADLQNGNIDAQIVEDTWAAAKVKDGDGITICEEPVTSFEVAAVFPTNAVSAKDAFNKAFATIKDNGTYDSIVETWFN